MNKVKKCFIMGAGELGRIVRHFLENEYIQVLSFGDNDPGKGLYGVDGLEVHTQSIIVDNYLKGMVDFVVVAIRSYSDRLKMCEELYCEGVRNIKVAPEYLLYKKATLDFDSIFDELEEIRDIKPEIEYLEVHASEVCNLNCRGCGHFANIADKEKTPFLEVGSFRKDMLQLKTYFQSIKVFSLMGGEPLLAPKLDQYVVIIRENFPKTKIQILTNGLLIDKMSYTILDSLRKNNVVFVITQYPPTEEKMFEITRFLHKNFLDFYIAPFKVKNFAKLIVEAGNEEPKKSYQNCPCKYRPFLESGKMYICPTSALIKRYNCRFDMKINPNDNDYIDIHNFYGSGWDIIKSLKQPSNMCHWCAAGNAELFQWKTGGEIVKEDWLKQVDRKG